MGEYYKRGYEAIIHTPPDFKAFGEALNKALRDQDDSWGAKSQVYEGGFLAAVDRKGDDDLMARSVIETIMAIELAYGPKSIVPDSSIEEGVKRALNKGNFIVALLLIEHIPSNNFDQTEDCLFWTIVAAFTLKPTPVAMKGILTIFRALLDKYNAATTNYNKRTDRLFYLVDMTSNYIRLKKDENSDILKALLSILVQYVVLPKPPTEGPDPYKEAREMSVKVDKTKRLSIQRMGIPGDVVNNMTFGLPQRFCTKCNKGVAAMAVV